MLKNRVSAGFSLIELLVVIAIIGLLVAVVIVSTVKTREKGRNTQRISGMLQLQVAIEEYFELHRVYPSPCAAAVGGWAGANAAYGSCVTNYIQNLTPRHIAVLPLDPFGYTGTNYGYLYATFNSGQDYKLMIYGGIEGKPVSPNNTYARCASKCDRGTYPYCGDADPLTEHTYAVYTPEAACL